MNKALLLTLLPSSMIVSTAIVQSTITALDTVLSLKRFLLSIAAVNDDDDDDDDDDDRNDHVLRNLRDSKCVHERS